MNELTKRELTMHLKSIGTQYEVLAQLADIVSAINDDNLCTKEEIANALLGLMNRLNNRPYIPQSLPTSTAPVSLVCEGTA